MSKTLAWSAPIETEKIRTHHAKVVVECTTGKPYYSIEWLDTAKQEYYLGYSSYCIDNVLGWLNEFFEIVEAPKTNADRIRAMSDEELYIWAKKQVGCGFDFFPCGVVCDGKCESFDDETCKAKIMEWLKQPAG